MAESEPSSGVGETSYLRVTVRLRNEIVEGLIPPGSWLRMVALAERYGVSVQPVRDALQQLEGEGLVEMLPNRGARVRGIDRIRLIHIYEIREAMESFLARRFAEEASLSDIKRLEAVQQRHDDATASADIRLIGATNDQFHNLINGHGGNREALDLVIRYYGLSQILRSLYGFSRDYADRVRREHHALLDAFRRRDASAAADIGAAHVRGTRADMLSRLDAVMARKDVA